MSEKKAAREKQIRKKLEANPELLVHADNNLYAAFCEVIAELHYDLFDDCEEDDDIGHQVLERILIEKFNENFKSM